MWPTLIIILYISCVSSAADIKPMSLNGQSNLNLLERSGIGGTQQSVNDYVQSNNVVNGMHVEKDAIQSSTSDMHRKNQQLHKRVKIAASSVLGIAAVHFIFQHRHKLPSKDDIQKKAFRIASSIKAKGHIGIVYFIACIAACEMSGLSTSPLEISGGFVYGIKKGFGINIMGKLCGALTAYIIGRTFLAEKIRSKFFSNSANEEKDGGELSKSEQIFQLVQTCMNDEPITTALVVRYSFFPHVIKNLLLSVMEPIHWKLFLMVTFVQIMPFTLLFTSLGYDSALRLLQPDLEINYILSAGILATTVYTFVVPTGVVALWYGKKSKKLQ